LVDADVFLNEVCRHPWLRHLIMTTTKRAFAVENGNPQATLFSQHGTVYAVEGQMEGELERLVMTPGELREAAELLHVETVEDTTKAVIAEMVRSRTNSRYYSHSVTRKVIYLISVRGIGGFLSSR
jgi:hypothetical protein